MKKINVDIVIMFFVIFLLFFNVIMIWSSSNKNIILMYKTIININVSIITMILVSKIDYKNYQKFSTLIYIFTIILLIIVFFFGNTCKGAKRWLSIGFIKFQPSELTKISIPLIMSNFISKYGCPNSIKSLLKYLFILFIPSFLTFIQPDLGTSIIILMSGFFILFISGIKLDKIILIFIFFFIASIINWNFLMKKYQKDRIIILFNNNKPFGMGYHILQSKIAIGSGGFLGKGLFKGTQSKLKFVPESHTDFIFSVIGEEFGLLGAFFILILYLGLILRILYISINSINIFSKVLISSFAIIIFLNVFINIGMVIGILPVVGIPLPLLSYGGSSLIVTFIKFGIINSIILYKKNYSLNFK